MRKTKRDGVRQEEEEREESSFRRSRDQREKIEKNRRKVFLSYKYQI